MQQCAPWQLFQLTIFCFTQSPVVVVEQKKYSWWTMMMMKINSLSMLYTCQFLLSTKNGRRKKNQSSRSEILIYSYFTNASCTWKIMQYECGTAHWHLIEWNWICSDAAEIIFIQRNNKKRNNLSFLVAFMLI